MQRLNWCCELFSFTFIVGLVARQRSRNRFRSQTRALMGDGSAEVSETWHKTWGGVWLVQCWFHDRTQATLLQCLGLFSRKMMGWSLLRFIRIYKIRI